MFSHQLNRRQPKPKCKSQLLSIAAGCDCCDPKLLQWMECSFSILGWMWWLNKILKEKKRSFFPSLEVAFDPWIIYQVFSQNSIIYCGQYMLSFRSDFSFHSWNVSSPQVWRCAKATHPLLARQLRERLEEHCSKEVVLPGDDPNQSYLYLGFWKPWPLIYEKSQGVFNNKFERRGIQCMVERCLLIYIYI